MFKKYCTYAISGTVIGYGCYKIIKNKKLKEESAIFSRRPILSWSPPPRNENIKNLKNTYFDLLIIGGGSAGSGCALDATTRGLSVALIEGNDFASETSSKSTKLLHGGIRYLEKAFKKFDINQFKLVHEALHERKTVIENAPYLCNELPIMIPVYNKFLVPYFWVGMKMYDWISGSKSLGSSYYMNKQKTIERFPAIKKENLCGSIVYYDGQFNDSRLNVMLAMTSSYYGATVANYVKVTEVIKKNGKVVGALCEDVYSKNKKDKPFFVKARGVINTTGPFIDKIREMDDKKTKSLIVPSTGVHLVIPNEFAPHRMGFVLPGTSDGRVLFILPWQGKGLVGTTDNKCDVMRNPKAKKEDIDFIIDEIREHISFPETLGRKQLLSAWAGIRPLVKDPNDKKTESLVRNHLIDVSPSKMITLSGGKWTTYRQMAEETINKAVKIYKLNPKRGCVTEKIKILGAHGYNEEFYLRLKRDMNLPVDTAEYLARTYGDRSYKFREYFYKSYDKLKKDAYKKLEKDGTYSFLEKEVEYCVDNEMALKISDILGRRLRLGFIDVEKAAGCVGKIANIMSKKLKWNGKTKNLEVEHAKEYLKSLGLGCNKG